MVDLAVDNVTTRLDNLEPSHVPDGLRGSGESIIDGFLDAGRRGADQLDLLVNVIAHAGIFAASASRNKLKPRGADTGAGGNFALSALGEAGSLQNTPP